MVTDTSRAQVQPDATATHQVPVHDVLAVQQRQPLGTVMQQQQPLQHLAVTLPAGPPVA